MTVRQAIQELQTEGRVVAEHGRGVFVRQPAPVAGWPRTGSFAVTARPGKRPSSPRPTRSASRPGVDQIEVTEGPRRGDAAERLRLAAGRRRSSSATRRYLADDEPVETAVSYLPLASREGTAITEVNTGPGGIYARLEEAGHELGHFIEEVTARMPTADERRR